MGVIMIPMNLSKLESIPEPHLNISTDPSQVIEQIIVQSNTATKGLIGYFSMFFLSLISFFVLADKSPNGDFGYSDLRALGLSFAISLLIGLTLVSTGFIQNFVCVGTFTILLMVSMIALIIYENKE